MLRLFNEFFEIQPYIFSKVHIVIVFTAIKKRQTAVSCQNCDFAVRLLKLATVRKGSIK